MAASGMRSRMESLDLLANNLANASTGGYKADREFYSLYAAPEAEGDSSTTMPVIREPYTDLSQGVLQSTGGPLDVALSGKGFFAVQGPSGPLYTRNGNFRLESGCKLISAEGHPVSGTRGAAITLPGTRPIEISSDGTVTQAGKIIGQLQISDFTSGADSRSKVTTTSAQPIRGDKWHCPQARRWSRKAGSFQQRDGGIRREIDRYHAPV